MLACRISHPRPSGPSCTALPLRLTTPSSAANFSACCRIERCRTHAAPVWPGTGATQPSGSSPEAELLDAFWQSRGVMDPAQRAALVAAAGVVAGAPVPAHPRPQHHPARPLQRHPHSLAPRRRVTRTAAPPCSPCRPNAFLSPYRICPLAAADVQPLATRPVFVGPDSPLPGVPTTWVMDASTDEVRPQQHNSA
jgi:hypothetical protein